jgi:hypothetical protein
MLDLNTNIIESLEGTLVFEQIHKPSNFLEFFFRCLDCFARNGSSSGLIKVLRDTSHEAKLWKNIAGSIISICNLVFSCIFILDDQCRLTHAFDVDLVFLLVVPHEVSGIVNEIFLYLDEMNVNYL